MKQENFAGSDFANRDFIRRTMYTADRKRQRNIMISLCAVMLVGFVVGSLVFVFFGRNDETAVQKSLCDYIASSPFTFGESIQDALWSFLCRIFFDEKFLFFVFFGAYTIYASVVSYALALYKGFLCGFSASVFTYALRFPENINEHFGSYYLIFLAVMSLASAALLLFCTKAICFSNQMRLCDEKMSVFITSQPSITFFCEFLLFSVAYAVIALVETVGFAIVALL